MVSWLHHHIKLNKQACHDIERWLTFLSSWNGIPTSYKENSPSLLQFFIVQCIATDAASYRMESALVWKMDTKPIVLQKRKRHIAGTFAITATGTLLSTQNSFLLYCDNQDI